MIRACGAAMAAVALLGKVAVGFVVLIVLVEAVLPPPSRSPDARCDPGRTGGNRLRTRSC